MLLKAGAVSFGLLLASRLLGLLRESALAATFGTSGLADVAVLMLTLPDWLAGVLASGALSYVLLPVWAAQGAGQVAATQRRVAQVLLVAGSVLAVVLILLRAPAVEVLAAGLPTGMRAVAAQALVWSALAVPAALVAALWVTRLQHGRDFVGMYSASLVVNLVLVAAIAGASFAVADGGAVARLGVGLLIAAGVRLAWLRWRQGSGTHGIAAPARSGLPAAPVWLWAVLSASLPLALPFVARSMASQAGEGSLATFNYAWKLAELPLLLAIQLVATLAFPGIARALTQTAAPTPPSSGRHSVCVAFGLAFSLACASAAGLLAGAPALAQLLFGWGRMEPEALERVAQWGRIAAWGLLPQALIAVALTVLAARGRMGAAVLGYGLALAGLLGAGSAGVVDGGELMWILNLLLSIVACISVAAMGREAFSWLPWRVLSCALGALLLVAFTLSVLPPSPGLVAGLVQAVICACVVLGAAWLVGGELRGAPGHNSSASHD